MAWDRQPPQIFEGEDEFQLKLEYARVVARNPSEALLAGYQVFPGDENYGRAMQASAWLHDPFVQKQISILRETCEATSLLPDDAVVQLEILQEARAAPDPKDKATLYKLYCESKGIIAKAGTNVNINQDNRVVNVLRVPRRDVTPEDDAAFERKFYIDQNALIADAKSSRPSAG